MQQGIFDLMLTGEWTRGFLQAGCDAIYLCLGTFPANSSVAVQLWKDPQVGENTKAEDLGNLSSCPTFFCWLAARP